MPLLIDFFCGEGGAAQGFVDAGWTVIGVDIRPQPRLPARCGFIQCDFRSVDPRLIALADALHASPPCQFGTELNSHKHRHVNLIPETREIFRRSGKPYVIENVRKVAKHLIAPVSLYGTMFDNHAVASDGQRFDLSRERCFEANWPLEAPPRRRPAFPIANVYGGHFRVRSGAYRTGNGTGRTVDLPGEDRQALARQIMGMPWATMGGMSEAVPPSYTRHIGEQLLMHLDERWTFGQA